MKLAYCIEINHRDKRMSVTENKSGKTSNDFIVGLVTFIIFIIFMTVWMYVGTTD